MKLWTWLLVLATGLLILNCFAPLSGPVDAIFSVVAIAILLVYSVTGLWEERRERKADRPSSDAISSSD